MIDYWNKLKLDECWSKKQRFNIMMNYIMDGETPSESTEEPTPTDEPTEDEPTDEPVIENTGKINVTVTDEEGNPIKDADVSVYSNGEPFEGTTGKAGGCTIKNVPYGDYTIEAVAEGYDFTVEQITVNQSEQSRTLVLKSEADDNV